jgi:mRNA-degrading endonuclease HigB of HigAB toxin-antitoxin module
MRILNTLALTRFAKKHRNASATVNRWLELALHASWHSIVDVRAVLPSADGVTVTLAGGTAIVATVFNIKSFRLITVIDYDGEAITVIECLTHGEYDKGHWKNRL